MWFLMKSAFWLSVVLMLIPFSGGNGEQSDAAVGPVETIWAAKAMVSDVANICERRPDACEVGKSALHTIGVRAKEGVRIAYSFLDEHFADEPREPVHTGSIPAPDATETE